MIETGTILQNRYLIEKQIGAGGMGAVYLAVDRRFESFVAIKETFYQHDELGDAFEREAKLLNGLHHPNLPHVSDYFTEGGGHFLVMQFIEGEDLFEILKRDGAFSLPDVLRWTFSLLDALDYLHSHEPPIIHRDIKPQNLKITTRGDVILLDFGLAKLNSDDTQNALSVFGYSRKYSPLEQIQGTGTDARSDIFALGATVYHLLTGKPPLDALTRAAAIVAGNPDPLVAANEINGEVPVIFAQILHTALKLNADQRFDSVKAIRQALEQAVVGEAGENVDALPEQALTIAAWDDGITNPDAEIINSAETESFPALEAFAAETVRADLPETNLGDRTAAIEIPAAPVFLPAPENMTRTTVLGDTVTRIAPPRKKQFRLPLAAAALLLCAVLAAGYYINRASSSNESNQTPIVETAPASNASAEQTAIVSDVPPAEITDATLTENIAPAKPKSRSVEKTVGKKEIVQEMTATAETAEKSKPVSDENSRPSTPVENSRSSAPARNPRRTQTRDSGETRSRVVESAPVSDIESVFTGQPTEQEKLRRGAERRVPRDELSDEELREMRRRRREKRRERQNENPFPF